METLTIGGLLFTPSESRGGHVHVVVRGHGLPGSRPLLGHLWMNRAEWNEFCAVEEVQR